MCADPGMGWAMISYFPTMNLLRAWRAGCSLIIAVPYTPSLAPAPAAAPKHQPPPEHAAEVREVRHAGDRAGDAEIHLERGEQDHEHARRQRDRREQQDHRAPRE